MNFNVKYHYLRTMVQIKKKYDEESQRLTERLRYLTSADFIQEFNAAGPHAVPYGDGSLSDKLSKSEGDYGPYFKKLFASSFVRTKGDGSETAYDWRANILTIGDNDQQCLSAMGHTGSEKVIDMQKSGDLRCYICQTIIAPEGKEKVKCTFEKKGKEITKNTNIEKAQCEHILPIITALANWWLVKHTKSTYFKIKLRGLYKNIDKEYDWSHACCNLIKNSFELIRFRKKGKKYLCEPDDESIIELVRQIVRVGETGAIECPISVFDCSNIYLYENNEKHVKNKIWKDIKNDFRPSVREVKKVMTEVFEYLQSPSSGVNMSSNFDDILLHCTNRLSSKGPTTLPVVCACVKLRLLPLTDNITSNINQCTNYTVYTLLQKFKILSAFSDSNFLSVILDILPGGQPLTTEQRLNAFKNNRADKLIVKVDKLKEKQEDDKKLINGGQSDMELLQETFDVYSNALIRLDVLLSKKKTKKFDKPKDTFLNEYYKDNKNIIENNLQLPLEDEFNNNDINADIRNPILREMVNLLQTKINTLKQDIKDLTDFINANKEQLQKTQLEIESCEYTIQNILASKTQEEVTRVEESALSLAAEEPTLPPTPPVEESALSLAAEEPTLPPTPPVEESALSLAAEEPTLPPTPPVEESTSEIEREREKIANAEREYQYWLKTYGGLVDTRINFTSPIISHDDNELVDIEETSDDEDIQPKGPKSSLKIKGGGKYSTIDAVDLIIKDVINNNYYNPTLNEIAYEYFEFMKNSLIIQKEVEEAPVLKLSSLREEPTTSLEPVALEPSTLRKAEGIRGLTQFEIPTKKTAEAAGGGSNNKLKKITSRRNKYKSSKRYRKSKKNKTKRNKKRKSKKQKNL